MFEFPYMQSPTGIVRPMIAIAIEGPGGRRLLDGLVDTGADRTIFPAREAAIVGLSLPANVDGTIKTAGGVMIPYRVTDAVLELRGSGASVRWRTSVAFADEPLAIIHLGTRGFLEYFHCTFLGPEKRMRLVPCSSLPAN